MTHSQQALFERFEWYNPPKRVEQTSDQLLIEPQGETDCIRSFESTIADSASFYFTRLSGDFTFQAKLDCQLVGLFDAGALMVRESAECWAKICIEKCADGGISIVSVVTDGWSDDTNNEVLQSPEAYLRITRKGNMIGLHYSLDGKQWRFVRKFGLPWSPQLQVGVAAQAPRQAGCKVSVEQMSISNQPVADFRNGE
ncbi:DUF1349 domain-containing protein [Photobacterium rosenbergii]|uniref:DUF1349 domain-containing protein n=1 Tax=Photobacterium rosenbergii TaxID=294936 RepID=A0A2T3N823_9GAMM|nr:DUF1349 domain-containing protein [Photobacterium rosenbergii]PSW09248.1 DUF1349 domain-containing protein [Photobacterium rosenbergii]